MRLKKKIFFLIETELIIINLLLLMYGGGWLQILVIGFILGIMSMGALIE